MTVQDLALEVRGIHGVVVDHGQRADAGRRQREDDRRPQAARADDGHVRPGEAALPDVADAGEGRVSRCARPFRRGQIRDRVDERGQGHGVRVALRGRARNGVRAVRSRCRIRGPKSLSGAAGAVVASGMASYKIAQAARLLGVSDDTVRRWIDAGTLSTTGATPAEIAGEELAAHAVRLAAAPPDSGDFLVSARNRFTGLVTRIQIDRVMAQVDIQAGPHRVVSLLSAEAVRELGLEVGSLTVAVIKATNVIIETPRP